MQSLSDHSQLSLARGFRLQFEPTQQRHVLLYPEGMVELSDTAAVILEQCQTPKEVVRIVDHLTELYASDDDIGADIRDFLQEALTRGWIIAR